MYSYRGDQRHKPLFEPPTRKPAGGTWPTNVPSSPLPSTPEEWCRFDLSYTSQDLREIRQSLAELEKTLDSGSSPDAQAECACEMLNAEGVQYDEYPSSSQIKQRKRILTDVNIPRYWRNKMDWRLQQDNISLDVDPIVIDETNN